MNAFHALLLQYQKPLYNHALSLVKTREKAEDLLSEVNIKILAAEHQFQTGTNFKAWVHTIMRFHFFSQRRIAWRQQELSDDWTVPTPATQPFVTELSDIASIIATMPVDMRNALLLRASGMASKDIAQLQHVEDGTSKSRISRARDYIASHVPSPDKRPPVGTAYDYLLMLIDEASLCSNQ